ncbi:EamA-like transporter family protein [Hoeflea marina]|uniref:EamA-like transporter family protein n=1 Tax=Hoeflea marina TaxID=274592 RepID=A0A317PMY3_9HYPH|nr:DMT family transporter [Hoeflea marina]PWW01418.1 EamA-like transporter family protein [Hoeflea marina]
MPQTYRPLAATLWMMGSIGFFSMMAISGRMVSGLHDTFEIMTWRSLVGFVIVLAVAGGSGRLGEVRVARFRSHLARNLCHFTGQNLWFWALALIPLAQVFALEFTSPVWVILLSVFILKEPLTLPRLVATVLGFLGILIVVRPDFNSLNPGVVAAATAAIFFAATLLLTKSLTRDESAVSILFWLTLMQLCFGAIMTGYDGVVTWPTATTLPWLVAIGISGLAAHFCLTTALALAPASFVIPIDFARLPVIAIVGMVLFHEQLDWFVFLGGGVIFLANWINIRAANRVAIAAPV